MFHARPEARLLVSGVRALIREGGEQGPPGAPQGAPQRVAGLRVFLARGHRPAVRHPIRRHSRPPFFRRRFPRPGWCCARGGLLLWVLT